MIALQSLFKLLLLFLSCNLKKCSAPNDDQVVFVPVNPFVGFHKWCPRKDFRSQIFFNDKLAHLSERRKIGKDRSGSAKSKHDDPGGFGTNSCTPLSLTSETLEMRSARVKLCWVAPPPPPPRSIFSAMEASWARLNARTLTTFLFFQDSKLKTKKDLRMISLQSYSLFPKISEGKLIIQVPYLLEIFPS